MGGGIKPIVTVDWSPTTNPLDVPTWVNVPRWRKIDISRGRRSEVDQVQAGTASILLDNRDRRFDPLYTAGANYPNVLPMKRFRVRALYNAVTYDLFQGFVDSWDQTFSNPRDGTVELRCTDAFELLNAAVFSPSPYEVEVRTDNPVRWYRLGEPAGAVTVTDVIGGAVGTVAGGTFGVTGLVADEPDTAFSVAGGDGQGVIVNQADAFISDATDFTVEFLVNFRTFPAAQLGTLWGQNSAATGFRQINLYVEDTGQVHWEIVGALSRIDGPTLVAGTTYHVVARSGAAGYALYVNGVSVGTTSFGDVDGGPTLIAAGAYNIGSSPDAVIDDFAVYHTMLSATRIAAHSAAALAPWADDTTGQRIGRALDYLGLAAGDRNVDTTTTILQAAQLNESTSVLAHMQDVNQVEQGLLFVTKDGKVRFRGRAGGFNLTSSATFGDGAGELPYADIAFDYSNQSIFNVVRRQNQGGLLMEASDATSIAAYGRRVDSKTGMIGASDLAALDLANYRLGKAKDPVVRVTDMTVAPERAPATLYPQVLGREIGEQLTVKRRPQGVGAVMTFDARIEGVSHTITPDSWSAKFLMSPADTAQYLQLDLTSGPGLGSLRLAY